MWAMLAMQPVAVLLFIAYEVTEGWRLNDWSYRDIGGFMGGWVFGLTLFLMGAYCCFSPFNPPPYPTPAKNPPARCPGGFFLLYSIPHRNPIPPRLLE